MNKALFTWFPTLVAPPRESQPTLGSEFSRSFIIEVPRYSSESVRKDAVGDDTLLQAFPFSPLSVI
jgi:hypothetical protein